MSFCCCSCRHAPLQSSICEEGEEEEDEEEEAEEELRLTESFSCWQPQLEATSPVRLPKSDAEATCADVLLGDLGPSFNEVRRGWCLGLAGSWTVSFSGQLKYLCGLRTPGSLSGASV